MLDYAKYPLCKSSALGGLSSNGNVEHQMDVDVIITISAVVTILQIDV